MAADHHSPTSCQRLEAYTAKKILPRFNKAGKAFRLESANHGKKNLVFYLHLDGTEQFMLKCYRKKGRMKNGQLANRFLKRCNINIPEIAFTDSSDRTYRQVGCYIICQKRIIGTTIEGISEKEAALRKIALFYANLHSFRSSRWGRFTAGRKYGFSRYIMDKVVRRLEPLTQDNDLFTAEDRRLCYAWFEGKKDCSRHIRHFSLCHTDIHRDNIIIDKSGEVYIVGVDSIRYLPFPLEYYRLAFTLCEDNDQYLRLFENAYFNSCSQERRKEFELCGDFFKAYALLEIAWHCNKYAGQRTIAEHLRNDFLKTRKKAGSALRTLTARQ